MNDTNNQYQNNQITNKSKTIAGFLAIFLGWLGIHKFYLGKTSQGILYLLCGTIGAFLVLPTLIIIFISFIEGITYFCMNNNIFNAKYNTVISKQENTNSSQEIQNIQNNNEVKGQPAKKTISITTVIIMCVLTLFLSIFIIIFIIFAIPLATMFFGQNSYYESISSEATLFIGQVKFSQEIYALTHNGFTNSFDNLDIIAMPADMNCKGSVCKSKHYTYMLANAKENSKNGQIKAVPIPLEGVPFLNNNGATLTYTFSSNEITCHSPKKNICESLEPHFKSFNFNYNKNI